MCDRDIEIDETAYCGECLTSFWPDLGVTAEDEELYCSEDCAREANFNLSRDA